MSTRRPAEPPRPPGSTPESKTSSASVGGLLTAADLAARWKVPCSQVYRLTRDHRLPVVRIGRYYRYAIAAVQAFEQAGGTP